MIERILFEEIYLKLLWAEERKLWVLLLHTLKEKTK